MLWDPALFMRLEIIGEFGTYERDSHLEIYCFFLLLTSNLVLEIKIINLNLFPNCFLFSLEKLMPFLLRKKIVLRRLKDNSIMTKNPVGCGFVASYSHKKVK